MSDNRAAERPIRVLVVEDDLELCELMTSKLTRNGFQVSHAHDGPTGLRRAIEEQFDVVTLDAMLPDLDGFELLRQLRQRSLVPVVMLTARGAAEDRISGLESGADDYLPKPFHPGELLARLRAVIRRSSSASHAAPAELAVGDVRLSRSERQVTCRGSSLSLTTGEFDVLELLMRRAGLAVSRDDISLVLYQRPAQPFERGLDLHVSHLRKKLQAAGIDPIRTVRGIGYLFARP